MLSLIPRPSVSTVYICVLRVWEWEWMMLHYCKLLVVSWIVCSYVKTLHNKLLAISKWACTKGQICMCVMYACSSQPSLGVDAYGPAAREKERQATLIAQGWTPSTILQMNSKFQTVWIPSQLLKRKRLTTMLKMTPLSITHHCRLNLNSYSSWLIYCQIGT